ncbi:MAG TPA: hypothetical protein VEJ19_00985 [Nitrososphaerales archaeon]|nr:hypothetical protein [Nitrososphaerales archaeon]
MKLPWRLIAICLALLCLTPAVSFVNAQSAPSMTVSPTAGIAGSTISISGQGYPPNTNLVIKWDTVNASYVVSGNPSQVVGLNAPPWERPLVAVVTNALGSFSASLAVPQDYGSYYTLQAFTSNGTTLPGKAYFTLDTSFTISPSNGPDGTPIVVTSTGLGTGLYTFCYFLYWDNTMVGYYSGISTRGTANFTFYASGTTGSHLVEAYGAYPGPGYLNPQQSPYPTLVFTSMFNITSGQSSGGLGLSSSTTIGTLAALAAIVGAGGLFVSVAKFEPERRKKLARSLAVIMIIIAIAIAGFAAYFASTPSSSTAQASYTPQATVVRPAVYVPQNNATTGPRISVSPDIASVGQSVTVNGAGFPANTQEALSWSTRKGSNIKGFKLVTEPLQNVTTDSSGSFSFNMNVPADLGGFHYISAGNLTPNSNGTVFIQRTASINATQGPAGSVVAITLLGVGWTFNTNIAALDYDNSYIGFGCGFNSGGNVTFYLTITGAPGIQTIDVYPSVWWGNSTPYNKIPIEYDFPMLSPQDHPALMPSFHFTFLITGSGQQGQSGGAIFPYVLPMALVGSAIACVFPPTTSDSDSTPSDEVSRK